MIDGPTRLSKQLKEMRVKLKIIINETDKKGREAGRFSSC